MKKIKAFAFTFLLFFLSTNVYAVCDVTETNTLNGDWGKDEGEVINTNTIYTVVYNWDTHSLSLKE